ncbi:MAG: IS1634 family transposase [Nitrospiraceae bacterium]
MYIRKTTKNHKGKPYHNYLLVESVHTPQGPRQRTICSLGSLSPGPAEQWHSLALKVKDSLEGQLSVEPVTPQIETLVEKVQRGRKDSPAASGRMLTVDTDGVTAEEFREAGPVHVGHQVWRQLGLDEILKGAGLSDRACLLSETMTLNRLIFPLSELAMPDWIRRTALADILGADFATLHEDALYRNLDRLHPNREKIETQLAERERTLFNLEGTVYLYDLTSTYFEGQAEGNPQAKRGYSRDKRPDCKQVVVGLVLDRDGFPKAHEVFDGNRQDRTTVSEILKALEKRTGPKPGATVVVDRGMAYPENLAEIGAQGFHYIVAGRQAERNPWLEDFEQEDDWEELIRTPSPRNPAQKKTKVEIKCRQKGDELYVLCLSDGRQEKDRAIREKHQQRLLTDLEKLKKRIETGHLKKTEKIYQALGRLQERYPRVARYYHLHYDAEQNQLSWREQADKKGIAEKLDGSYVLKTDRLDMTADEIWHTYSLLTRVEAAFRAMKSPLMERPIFHHLQHRVQTHIFLCVLAYHLLVAIEKPFLDQGVHTSWWTLRQQLSTHQVVTVVLPAAHGNILRIRKGGTPEPIHREIYKTLKIPEEVIRPVKTWQKAKT